MKQSSALDRLFSPYGAADFADTYAQMMAKVVELYVEQIEKKYDVAKGGTDNIPDDIYEVYSRLVNAKKSGFYPETLRIAVETLSKYFEAPVESFLKTNPDVTLNQKASAAFTRVMMIMAGASAAADNDGADVVKAMLDATLINPDIEGLLNSLEDALYAPSKEVFDQLTKEGEQLFWGQLSSLPNELEQIINITALDTLFSTLNTDFPKMYKRVTQDVSNKYFRKHIDQVNIDYDVENQGIDAIPDHIYTVYERVADTRDYDFYEETIAMGIQTMLASFGPIVQSFLQRNPDIALQKDAAAALTQVLYIYAGASVGANHYDKKNGYKEDETTLMFQVTLKHSDVKNLLTQLKQTFNNAPSLASKANFNVVKDEAPKLFTKQLNRLSQDLKRLDVELERLEKERKVQPMVEQMQKPYAEQRINYGDQEQKIRDLSRFDYAGPKKAGKEIGVMGRKKVKEGDEATKEKYEYTWMVKHQDIADTIMEKLSADIYRFLLGDITPKIHIYGDESQTQPYLLSKFLKNFQTLDAAYPEGKYTLEKCLNEYFKIPGALDFIAACVFVSNFDLNTGNLGLIDTINGKTATGVDYGRGLHLRAGYDMFTEKDCKYILKGANDLSQGEPYTPDVLIRSLHYGNFKIDSRYFLKEEFALALDALATKIENNPNAFAHVVMGSAKGVQFQLRNYANKHLLNRDLEQIADGTTLDNLGDKLFGAMMERTGMMKGFALNIRVQVAIRDDKADDLAVLLKQHPEIMDKPIKWLTDDGREKVYVPSTIKEFAQLRKASPEVMNVIAEAGKTNVLAKDEAISRKSNKETKPDKHLISSKSSTKKMGKVTVTSKKGMKAGGLLNEPHIVSSISGAVEGVAEVKEDEFKKNFLENIQKNIPSALEHKKFLEIGLVVYDRVSGHKGIPNQEKITAIEGVLNDIYANIPLGKHQAVAGHKPLYRTQGGSEIHRAHGWSTEIDRLIENQVKSKSI